MLLYCPPSTSRVSFLTEFKDFVAELNMTQHKLLLAGNFYLHIDNPQAPGTKGFCDILEASGLLQHVSTATHRAGHALDLVMSR